MFYVYGSSLIFTKAVTHKQEYQVESVELRVAFMRTNTNTIPCSTDKHL